MDTSCSREMRIAELVTVVRSVWKVRLACILMALLVKSPSPIEILAIRQATVRPGQSRSATGCFGLAPALSRLGSCLRNRVAARDCFLSLFNFLEIVWLATTSVPIPVCLSCLAHQTLQIEPLCKQLTWSLLHVEVGV